MNKSHHVIATFLAMLVAAPAAAQSGLESLALPPPPQAQTSQYPAGVVAPGMQAPVYGQQQAPVYGQQLAPAPVQAGRDPRDEAFERALRETMPLTPGQIDIYRQQMDQTQRAIVRPVAPGRPVSRSLRLTLRPGEETPILRVQPGVVSTLTFSDVTGQPWPVLSVVTGNPGAYVAQSAGEQGRSNIIVLSAIQPWVPSNMVVTLVGHPVPVSVALQQGEPETDYRVDVLIAARGPNASQDLVGISTLAPTNDSVMIAFLDGTPPNSAMRLRTTSSDVEAWRLEDRLFVRTRGDLMSPAYTATSSNISGVRVYELVETPVLIVSRDGQFSQVRILR